MRSLLFIFAALVSLIYAADPVGTWKSPCMGPTPITAGGKTYDLYSIETRTLVDGKQFESESYYYFDEDCALEMLIGRIQGTFTTSGTVSTPIFYDPASTIPVTGIDVQGIEVERTHYFVTSLDDTLVSPMLQLLCGFTTAPTAKVAFDIQQDGCLGLGIIGNDTCTTYLDLYFQQPGNIMNFGGGFGNYQTCGTRNTFFNPTNYTALAAPTLASGKYELGCTLFDSTANLYNTYYLEITATTGTTGKYSLTSSTFQGATCAQAALFSTTVLSATYTVDGYGVVENYMMDGKRPMQLNLVFTSKKVTPNNAAAAAILGSTPYCKPSTFTAGQATELNTNGCLNLGFPPDALCHSKHFDVAQEKVDGSGFYPGGATEFATHCSAESRVDTVSAKDWNTYVEPTPTVTPSPTSSSSSLAANVLLLISLLVFVLHF